MEIMFLRSLSDSLTGEVSYQIVTKEHKGIKEVIL